MRRVLFVLMVGAFAAALASAVFAADPTPVPAPIVVEGTITAMRVTTPTSGSITVQPPAPCPSCPVRAPITFAVNERTLLFKDGKACKLAEIKVGDGCRAMLAKTATGFVAQIVYAKTPPTPPAKWVKGTIVEKSVTVAWGKTFRLELAATTAVPALRMWFSVNDSTKITLDGAPATYDQLAVGQSAEVGYVPPPPSPLTVIQPILASAVAAKSPPPPPIVRVVGKLVGLDVAGGIIRVMPRDVECTDIVDCAVTFRVTNETRIDKFGPAKLEALTLGDTVDVAARLTPVANALPPAAISVIVLPETLSGIVDKVDLATGTLWVKPLLATGIVPRPVPIAIVDATKILKNGVPAPLNRIFPGDRVTVLYFQFGLVKKAALVEAKGPVTVL
jgi:hypothetical protein